MTKTYEYDLSLEEKRRIECVWEREKTAPFDELILSWNGFRPKEGKWTFWVSLKLKEWSPWLLYAEWGQKGQKTFKQAAMGSGVESYQDAVFAKEIPSEGFRIKVVAEEGADLEKFDSFFVCLSNLSTPWVSLLTEPLESVELPPLPSRSQLKLNHPRFLDLCSPTATTTVINYLLGKTQVDPIAFAEKIHDSEFNIFGNWILNTAQAFEELGGKFRCRVVRLDHFSIIHSLLLKGIPVIVSVRGPLVGSYSPLRFGHLMCVKGFDAALQRVFCMDPGFPEDEKTNVTYPLKDFLEAWGRRQNLSYLFTPKNC